MGSPTHHAGVLMAGLLELDPQRANLSLRVQQHTGEIFIGIVHRQVLKVRLPKGAEIRQRQIDELNVAGRV